MAEDQIYEEAIEKIVTGVNPQPSQPSQQSQASQQGPQSQSGNTGQAQQTSCSTQPQAAGIETSDNAIEEAEEHGQPSNTITERQRVHDKGYVERITEKTEKH